VGGVSSELCVGGRGGIGNVVGRLWRGFGGTARHLGGMVVGEGEVEELGGKRRW
jgi:hypothetical protein